MRTSHVLSLLLVSLLAVSWVAYAKDPLSESNAFSNYFPSLNKAAGTSHLNVGGQLWWIAKQSTVRYEAWACYHPTAKGKLLATSSLRRPSHEHTLRNKNIANLYAMHRLMESLSPHVYPLSSDILKGLGLDPEDRCKDHWLPSGIGNIAAEAVIKEAHNDGMNWYGDHPKSPHPGVQLADYTGYAPVNDHLHLYDPDLWQPNVYPDQKEKPITQVYLAPQLALLDTQFVNKANVTIDPPTALWKGNKQAYIEQAKVVMHEQTHLTDLTKMTAEFFDNKVMSLSGLGEYLVDTFGNGDIDYHTVFNYAVNNAILDALTVMWEAKTKYDGVRPFSAVHHTHAGKTIQGWGGPGKDIVNMDGSQWRSFVFTDAFPEYPSGTTCICTIWAEVAKLFIDDSTFDFKLVRPTGSSVSDPGHSPKEDVTIHYSNLEKMAVDCGDSRVWGGVHFYPAVHVARKACKPLGAQVYNKVMNLVHGK